VVLQLLVADEHGCRDDARRERVADGEQDGRDARQRSADHGQEVDQGDPQRPQERERNADRGERDEDHDACDERGE